jgi:hypothetical protein
MTHLRIFFPIKDAYIIQNLSALSSHTQVQPGTGPITSWTRSYYSQFKYHNIYTAEFGFEAHISHADYAELMDIIGLRSAGDESHANCLHSLRIICMRDAGFKSKFRTITNQYFWLEQILAAGTNACCRNKCLLP